MTEVILRDFDGAETIIRRDPPLPKIIHTEEPSPLGGGIPMIRHYLQTPELDPSGRPVYLQSNL